MTVLFFALEGVACGWTTHGDVNCVMLASLRHAGAEGEKLVPIYIYIYNLDTHTHTHFHSYAIKIFNCIKTKKKTT